MKIGISSYSFARHIKQTGASYFDVCDAAKSMGYSGIEFIDLSLEVQPAESIAALAEAISAHCKKIGLEIIAYTIGADFMKQDQRAEIERVKGCVDIAKKLGAPLMRHDATWQREGDVGEVIAHIAPAILEVTEYAAGQGIKTCTENHGYFIQDAERVKALIDAVGHENYGWLVDIGNFICADQDSVHAVKIAAPYAFHVHAKDFLAKPGDSIDPGEGWFPSRGGQRLRGTVCGHGVIPVKQCLDILRASGYKGFISYEFEGMEENLRALSLAHAYLEKILSE